MKETLILAKDGKEMEKDGGQITCEVPTVQQANGKVKVNCSRCGHT